MAIRPGESPEQSRQLDLYDYQFLRWCGESPERALARVGVSALSLQRWTAERAKYLGSRRLLRLPYPVLGTRPEEESIVDTSQVSALD